MKYSNHFPKTVFVVVFVHCNEYNALVLELVLFVAIFHFVIYTALKIFCKNAEHLYFL